MGASWLRFAEEHRPPAAGVIHSRGSIRERQTPRTAVSEIGLDGEPQHRAAGARRAVMGKGRSIVGRQAGS